MKKLKQLMNNEKGFTLVEILVVIAIIAILFVTLLPQIDNAVNRSRETGAKTDFHTMQTAMETYMRETTGNGLKAGTLNKYLDPGMAIIVNGTGLVSTKVDPWGKPYDVFVYPTHKAIVLLSYGPDERPHTAANPSTDDYYMATYYKDGQVGSCTSGFDTNNITTTILGDNAENITKCGKQNPAGAALTAPATAL